MSTCPITRTFNVTFNAYKNTNYRYTNYKLKLPTSMKLQQNYYINTGSRYIVRKRTKKEGRKKKVRKEESIARCNWL